MAAKIGARSGANQTNPAPESQLTSLLPIDSSANLLGGLNSLMTHNAGMAGGRIFSVDYSELIGRQPIKTQ